MLRIGVSTRALIDIFFTLRGVSLFNVISNYEQAPMVMNTSYRGFCNRQQ